MKVAVVSLSDIEIPSQMFAVLLEDLGSASGGSILALFAYADAATRWGESNYSGRFKVVEVRL